MPTPREAFAVVAATLGAIDPDDAAAVQRFYETTFVAYSTQVQEMVSYFLVCQTDVPSERVLKRLKRMVDRIG